MREERGFAPVANAPSAPRVQDGAPKAHEAGELLPCPFCGGRDIHVPMLRPTWVLCAGCKAEGPTGETRTDAIAAWNRRVPGKPHGSTTP